MSTVKLVTRKIKGADVDIFATEDGTFVATVSGERVEKPTLTQLVDRVSVILAAKLKPVEVSMLDRTGWHEKKKQATFKMVKLVGIHSGNGNMLINIGQVTQQLSERDGLFIPLTVEQQAEFFRLDKARADANEEYDKWVKTFTLTKALAHKFLGLSQKKVV